MAEAQSPNPGTAQKNRSKLAASCLQSPKNPFKNDDHHERAQIRIAALAAAKRRLSTVNATPPPDPEVVLGEQQIRDLHQNCLKLASENKINHKNTWDLNLIDHLGEIVKVEEEQDAETNFQKASCTLEAGVKIYSLRVDSTHSEAYKVLSGINRVGHEDDQDNIGEGDERGDKDGHTKKHIEKMTPSSTLEPSFEALNVKKFDAAFAVDPLYHQTSAQFDEGGAKGLLLNNLGVYGCCKVLFDSSEIPAKCTPSMSKHAKEDLIDLSFAQDYVAQMVTKMNGSNEISPTLGILLNRFDDDYQKLEFQQLDDCSVNPFQPFSANDISPEDDGVAYDFGVANFDDDEHNCTFDEEPVAEDSFPSQHCDGNDDCNLGDLDDDGDAGFEKVETYLFQNLGLSLQANAWAGPDHWKYRKTKATEDRAEEDKLPPVRSKRSKLKKKGETDIHFTAALNDDLSNIFALGKNPKSLLLCASRETSSTKLPEDCHYQLENLVKLFLLPGVMCLGKRRKRRSVDDAKNDFGEIPSWENENDYDGGFDNGSVHGDIDDSSTFVSQPRQVNRIEVQYDKTSKQVDVQAIKEVLWQQIQDYSTDMQLKEENEGKVSFKDLLAHFPSDCRAASNPEDISPHLCFICLLHLANEHCLRIQDCDAMDDLSIYLPDS